MPDAGIAHCSLACLFFVKFSHTYPQNSPPILTSESKQRFPKEMRGCGQHVPDAVSGTFFDIEENKIMSKSNKTLVPEAKEAMNQFKMEAANDEGVI